MLDFQEYLEQGQGTSNILWAHYDQHTDRWVDEAKESIYGHSGHCDVHTDAP